MAYVIRRTTGKGGYVAWGGSASSYVQQPDKARTWPTREMADQHVCTGNEVVEEYHPGHFARPR